MCFSVRRRRPSRSTLFPYTTLFRSVVHQMLINAPEEMKQGISHQVSGLVAAAAPPAAMIEGMQKMGFSITHVYRSEEHTSELQSHHDLVCRLLLEKKKTLQDIPLPQ